MNIIALNGYKRSGKGVTADFIEEQVEGTVLQVGFADKLKALAARSVGYLDPTFSDVQCVALMDEAKEHWKFKIHTYYGTKDLSGREYLQHMGTEARKLFGADFWADQVLPSTAQYDLEDKSDRYDELLEAKYPSVDWLLITDLRFENEAQRVLDLGGEVWRVNHPGAESDGHDSEQRLPDHLVTREIDNSGTLDDLRNAVHDIVVAPH